MGDMHDSPHHAATQARVPREDSGAATYVLERAREVPLAGLFEDQCSADSNPIDTIIHKVGMAWFVFDHKKPMTSSAKQSS